MFFMSGKTLPTDREKKTDWNWASYFRLKKQKLQAQFNENNNDDKDETLDEVSRSLFKNVGIFVNGYTNPTSIELKGLMQKYGGIFFDYPNESITHIIASNLAYTKALAMRNRLVVKPEWITDCIKQKRILSTDEYRIGLHDKNQNKLTSYLFKNSSSGKNACKISAVPITPKITYKMSNYRKLSGKFQTQKTKTVVENSEHRMEYKCFKQRISQFQLPDHINKSQTKQGLELEKIKYLLSDWISWTSRSSSDLIDSDDLKIFRGYLFYLLSVRKQLEMLAFIMKLLRRLIEKDGSFEWIEAYKDLYSSIRTDFYIEFDSTLLLE